MNCDQVVELALFLEKRGPDIIKIVTRANDEYDLAESLKTMVILKKEIKTPISYHANGEAGMLSRIINPLLGSQIAFCVDRYSRSSTFEQIDLCGARTVVDTVNKMI
jgi:3-dehydroquinate dehydratase